MSTTTYELHITSYEGDLDYTRTKIIEGLDQNDVWAFMSVLRLFRSTHYGGWGNGRVKSEDLVTAFKGIASMHQRSKKFLEMFSYVPEEDEEFVGDPFHADNIMDGLYEIFGFMENEPWSNSDNGLPVRCYDSHKVYEVPQAKTDVTNLFVNP